MIDPSRLQPFDDFIVVRLDDPARTTSGGIVLPDDMANKKTKRAVTGTVESIGPGHLPDSGPGSGTRQPMDMAVGDVVVFNAWSGSEFELEVGGDKRLYISQRNIFGRVNPGVEPFETTRHDASYELTALQGKVN